MFFPKHFHKLSEANLTINNVFEIAYDLADSLSHLHFHEIVHGDIQVENIFLDDANQCYLANLYYNRERQSTIHEDIYAFGQLGKFLHEKIISNRDLIISGEDFENLKKLEELFHACGHSDVRLRPSAVILLEKIVNIRKYL
jgi:serine/threonine protein kinase